MLFHPVTTCLCARDMDRSHLTAEQAAKEEERLHEECTFTPDLATRRAAAAAVAAAAGRPLDAC